MAIFGFQIITTMITCLFTSRLLPYYSPGRKWLSNSLIRYNEPTDKQLKTFSKSGPYLGSGKRRNKGKHNEGDDNTFTLPKSSTVQLMPSMVQEIDVIQLYLFHDFQWLIDFFVSALCMYVVVDVHSFFVASQESNLSLIFCAIGVVMCIRVLLLINSLYFKADKSEGFVCLISGFFFLVVAMCVLITDNKYLEFDFVNGFSNFTNQTIVLLNNSGVSTDGPVSLLTYRIILALISALVGGLLTFPGIACAKGYLNGVRFAEGRPFRKVMLHLNFLMPLAVVLLWIRPVARAPLLHLLAPEGEEDDMWQRANEIFEALRLATLVCFVLTRTSLLLKHCQAHLNMALLKAERLRRDAGKISNVEYKEMINAVYRYLMVVALQYMCPVVLIAYFVLIMKSGGELSWTAGYASESLSYFSNTTFPFDGSNNTAVRTPEDISPLAQTFLDKLDDGLKEQSLRVIVALSGIRTLLPPLFLKSFVGYAIWWVTLTLFSSSLMGLLLFKATT